MKNEYLFNPAVQHENRLKQRAYYIPFYDSSLAIKRDIEENNCYFNLNGEWNFKYFECPLDLPDNIADICFEDKIPVPSCWECYGYGQLQYVNIDYPFQVNLPYTMTVNPIGVYNRTFMWNCEENKKQYLVFEGVDNAFAVYLNGEYIGFSKGSRNQAEFDITRSVCQGENILTVAVYTFCDGAYLEAQDCFRYHGIFRDVYILNRNEKHIKDISIETCVDGTVNLKADYTDTGISATFTLFDGDGSIIAENITDTYKIENPILWNAEKPYLYSVLIECNGEYIYKKIGFRSIGVTPQGELLINGVSVKIKGVNRHDSHPKFGYCATEEDMLKDIFLMKQHNVNCVRTAHYPNHPHFVEMCDEYGLYVIDECDMESHGIEHAYGLCSLLSGEKLAENPEWLPAYMDRIERLVIRDKNSPSIIMWSLGNEGQFGENHRKMSRWVKEYDDTRLVHYERTAWPNKGYAEDSPVIDSCVDIISRMYTRFDALDYQGRTLTDPRPYILAEYGHSMGLGPGGLEDYWELFYKYPRLIGGCIWEWCDHAVEKTDENGKQMYLYGGDNGDFPHDGNFCVDGLCYPDRTPHTGLASLKKVMQPFEIKTVDIGNGKFIVVNRTDFTDFNEYKNTWRIVCGKEILASGELHISVFPHESKEFSLDYSLEKVYNERCFIEFYSDLPYDTVWEKAGFNLAWSQIELPVCVERKPFLEEKTNSPSLVEEKRFVRITREDVTFVVDKAYGSVCEINFSVKNILNKPHDLDIWRVLRGIDNFRKGKWLAEYFHKAFFNAVTCKTVSSEDSVTVSFSGGLGAKARVPIFFVDVDYIFDKCGLTVNIKAQRNNELKSFNRSSSEETDLDLKLKTEVDSVPRFAMRFVLDKEFEKLEYFGKGPKESYIDFQNHASFGVWEDTVTNQYEPYIRPQECGNHIDTDWVKLESENNGFYVESDNSFEFSALHYSIEQLDAADHSFELEPSEETDLLINYKVEGIGSHSCGPELPEKYRLRDREINLNFRVECK